MAKLLSIQNSQDTWKIDLNRPEKRNALSAELVEELIQTIDHIASQKPKALIIKGNGKNFCAGFDLGNINDQNDAEISYRLIRIEILLQKIYSLNALTISYAHGSNAGAGVDILAACKLRYCSQDSSFRMPGAQFGLILGTRRFNSLVGINNSLPILSLSKKFDAITAKNIQFIHKIIEPADIDEFINQTITAHKINYATSEALYNALRIDDIEMDKSLAELVRSAVNPGIKQRLIDYINNE